MGLKEIISKILNRDGSQATLQNVEEVDMSAIFNDDDTSVLTESALLSVCALGDLVDVEADIKIKLAGNSDPVTIKAWQAIQRCYKVTKVYDTGTTVDVQYIKLNR